MGRDMPAETLRLIFESLVGEGGPLTRVGLVARSWRILSLPSLLKDVDLSSHNNGRVPEYETPELPLFRGVAMADYSDEFRPRSLVPRQRAFLRLMTDRPELAALVKSFAWTLVWMDFHEEGLTDIDLQTWDVFSRMQSVTRLDLASLHNIADQPYIPQNPARLFPAVTHLRLVGWMHRGLVKAIVTSLDVSKLSCLELDHLQDEGALHNGQPIPQDWIVSQHYDRVDPYDNEGITEELRADQERGAAAIFPGPMWFPLHFLRQCCLASLKHLQLRLGHFPNTRDQRSDITIFHETAKFIRSARDTLETISIGLGEHPTLHCKDEDLLGTCGTSRIMIRQIYRPVCFDLTSAFFHRLLPALTEEQFPHITRVDLEVFASYGMALRDRCGPQTMSGRGNTSVTVPLLTKNLLKRPMSTILEPFPGYDYALYDMDGAERERIRQTLETS